MAVHVERDSECPGCWHDGKLIQTCSVMQDHWVWADRKAHWFIHEPEEGLIECDFCGGVTEYVEEFDGQRARD